MATMLAHMTADEFECLPDFDRKRELNNGLIVEVDMARAAHELVKIRMTKLLVRALSNDFSAATDVTCRLSDDTERIPDLAIWHTDYIENMDLERTIVGGPLIAIEIVSSESAAGLNEKIQQYFAAGTKAVWVVYPPTRTVDIERPDGANTRLNSRAVLESPELVPGLFIKVSDIFLTLDKATANQASSAR